MVPDDIHAQLSILRVDHTVLAGRVGIVESRVEGLNLSLEAKHLENRSSIHGLRNGQQEVMDGLHRLEMKLAKATGYVIGAGAVIAVLVKFIDRIWK